LAVQQTIAAPSASRTVQDDSEQPPLLDALEKIRWRLFKSVGALFLSFIVGFTLVHYSGVTGLLVRPVRPFLENQDGRLAAFSPLTPFMLELKVAAVVAIVLALPIILYQVWAHFSPVLLPHEKRLILPSLFLGVVLFAGGVATGYYALPLSMGWLFGFQTDYVNLVIGADDYFSFVVRLLLAFGFVFEMPVVVMILTVLGLVTPKFLRDKRRHAIVVITILASLITPGDLSSTFLMIGPMIVLYELSIILSQAIHGRRPAPEEESAGASAEAV
jgi:sec-independent protein translocase protein TatC